MIALSDLCRVGQKPHSCGPDPGKKNFMYRSISCLPDIICPSFLDSIRTDWRAGYLFEVNSDTECTAVGVVKVNGTFELLFNDVFYHS